MLELYIVDVISGEWLGEIEVDQPSEILEALEDSDYIESEASAQLVPLADGEYQVLEDGKTTLKLTHTEPGDLEDEDDEDEDED